MRVPVVSPLLLVPPLEYSGCPDVAIAVYLHTKIDQNPLWTLLFCDSLHVGCLNRTRDKEQQDRADSFHRHLTETGKSGTIRLVYNFSYG